MAYKVGEKVRVIETLQGGETYQNETGGDDCATSRMERFRGRIVTICKVYNYGYRIKEDEGEWNWTDGMFKTLKDNEQTLARMKEIERKKTADKILQERMTEFETTTISERMAEDRKAQLDILSQVGRTRDTSYLDSFTTALRRLRAEEYYVGLDFASRWRV